MLLGLLVGILCAAAPAVRSAEGAAPFEEEIENYKKTPDAGEVRTLQTRIENGTARLAHEPRHGYLLSLLEHLKIPASSQLLVASKTSPNKARISPQNPRALYYNDSVSVAYVPSAEVIEIAAADPQLGVVFYTLDQEPSARPRITRDDRCLECHASAKTLSVPGLLVRSFNTREDGDVDLLGGIVVNHRTPLSERWGGYYVTGLHGAQTHHGNLFGAGAFARHEKDPQYNANLMDLDRFLDARKYPGGGSDIVALMVLEHQAYMQTLLTRLGYDSRKALAAGDDLRPVYPLCEAVLKYMLFADEARLASPVRGSGEFAAWFQSQGPADSQGRSLRQLDLQSRLFKYPCSYMIYSPSFQALPQRVRRHLYRRLETILSEEVSPEYPGLTRETRRAIHEILVATAKDLPVSWKLGGFASSSETRRVSE